MKSVKVRSVISSLLVIAATNSFANVIFSPYVDLTLNAHWDSQTQGMEPMDLVTPAKNEGIKSYHLAFITDSGNCQPAWGGQQEYSVSKQWGKSQTDLLNNNGVQLAVSFGGASNNDISYRCDHDQLVTTFNDVIKTYHASTLDFDIENGTANIPKLLSALKVVQQKNDKVKLSFTLPVMPEGLTPEGKEIIAAANQNGLNFNVNIMSMDYGPAYDGDMGGYAIESANSVHQFLKELFPGKMPDILWQFIEVTPMIGVNDVNTEQFTLKNADELKQFAEAKQLGGLSMWSLGRDKPCADKWASPICSGNNLQTQDYEYVSHLK